MQPRRIDQLAILCIFVSWFLLASVIVRLGTVEHSVRFVELAEVIRDPSHLFYGSGSPVLRMMFGAVSVALLVVAWIPSTGSARLQSSASCGPLLLMVCGVMLLYARTSGDYLAAPTGAGRISGSLIEFANGLARRGGGVVARHIAIGTGGYLGFAASLVLAARAIRRLTRKN